MTTFTSENMENIKCLFEQELTGYSFELLKMNTNNFIYVIEDSLILLLSYVPHFESHYPTYEDYLKEHRRNRYLEEDYTGPYFAHLKIQEVTPNLINFKFNSTKFTKKIQEYYGHGFFWAFAGYERFKGYKRLYWCEDSETTAEYVDRVMPELRLKERYNLWQGNQYTFIIFEAENYNQEKSFAVSYTTATPLTTIKKTADKYINTGVFGTDGMRFSHYVSLNKSLQSWKRVRRKKRLEEHLSYYLTQAYFRDKDDAWDYADLLKEKAEKGQLTCFEKIKYSAPKNKWVSEELVYRIVKRIYKNHKVIYQHRPYFLKSSIGGQMSYDIFITGLNIAIEYQGKQHFEPVDFFGGEENFKELKKRDEEKRLVSEKYGIKLVYINYWEKITPELIKQRVEE